MVREPRRKISAVTGLTGSGRVGGPGVSAQSPALERTEFWGRNSVSVNALQQNTGGRIVIEPGIERDSPVQEAEFVPLTAFGILGLDGEPAASLVVEEQELELDSVTDLGTEERIVSERKKKWSSVTLTDAQWIALGVLGGPGVSAQSRVLEMMELLGKSPVRVIVLPPNLGERIVTQLGIERQRQSPVLEKGASTLNVPKTATGATGLVGEPAARLVEEEEKLELDSATNLCMEGQTVKDKERRL